MTVTTARKPVVKPAKLTTAQRNQMITKAILDAITAGKGEWTSGILPAVKALNVTKSNDGLKIRACLDTLFRKGLVYRVLFTAQETYDLTANKVAPTAPERGFTISDGLYKGELVNLISAAHCAAYDGKRMPKSVTCSMTGIKVFLKVENGKFVVTLDDGADVTEQFNTALDKAVGMA